MKTCTKCKEDKSLDQFNVNKKGVLERDSHCKECKGKYRREYYLRNKQKEKNKVMEYRNNNKEWYREYCNKWQHENRHIWAEAQRAKRARCKTPISEPHKKELQEIYKGCPLGHEVDHIVPLNGELVSGLHVPWNLQYLPKHVNRAKSNKFNQGE